MKKNGKKLAALGLAAAMTASMFGTMTSFAEEQDCSIASRTHRIFCSDKGRR